MRPADLAYETALSFNSNRARSLLTILGIVIGISAVIAMTSLIGGIKQSLMGELGLDQARLIDINCWYGNGMQLSDVEALAGDMADDYEYVTPLTYGFTEEVASETEKTGGSVMGVLSDFDDARGMRMAQGRFLSKRECDTGSLVVVLDQPSVRLLYGSADEDVVGRKLRVSGTEYKIVGVVETQERFQRDNATLYAPLPTVCARVNGYNTIDQVFGFAREDADPTQVADRTRAWLIRHFNIPDDDAEGYLYIQTMKEVIDQVDQTVASFQVLMVAVASISLVVGGIGIMNMMLTNVTERIREIGLRKALGAKRADITGQFLLESVVLCLTGGVIGVVLGYASAFGLSGLMGGLASEMTGSAEFTPVIDTGAVLFATAVCVAIGVVFGYYPARRAARLDPVESLHYQ